MQPGICVGQGRKWVGLELGWTGGSRAARIWPSVGSGESRAVQVTGHFLKEGLLRVVLGNYWLYPIPPTPPCQLAIQGLGFFKRKNKNPMWIFHWLIEPPTTTQLGPLHSTRVKACENRPWPCSGARLRDPSLLATARTLWEGPGVGDPLWAGGREVVKNCYLTNQGTESPRINCYMI